MVSLAFSTSVLCIVLLATPGAGLRLDSSKGHMEPSDSKAKAGTVGEHNGIKYKFYVLNLDNRPERFRMFHEHMWPGTMKDHTCRIAAVNGRANLTADFAQGGRLHGRSNYPLPQTWDWNGLNEGSLGCFMSHTLAWDQIEKDGVDVGVVIEDDAYQYSGTFDDDMKRVILDPENVNNKHVILMGHCEGGIGDNVGLARGGTACTTAMAIYRKGIPMMKEKLFPVQTSIDDQLNLKLGYAYETGFELWRTQGKMVDQTHDDTDVQPNHDHYRAHRFQKLDEATEAAGLKAAQEAIPDC